MEAEVVRVDWSTWVKAFPNESLAADISRRFYRHRVPKRPEGDIKARNEAIRKRVDSLQRGRGERQMTNKLYEQVGREFGGLSERQVRRIVDCRKRTE